MHIIEDIDGDTSFLYQRAHSFRQAELHQAAIGDEQRAMYAQAFEVIRNFLGRARSELDRRHLHREDGFIGNIKATHMQFPPVLYKFSATTVRYAKRPLGCHSERSEESQTTKRATWLTGDSSPSLYSGLKAYCAQN